MTALLAAAGCTDSKSSVAARFGDLDFRRHPSHGFVVTTESPELRMRADSFARLDPRRDARAAIHLGDLRYLAACRANCAPIGIPRDTVCLLVACDNALSDYARVIDGTEVPAFNADVARFDSIVVTYAAKYNAVIRAFNQRRPPRRIRT